MCDDGGSSLRVTTHKKAGREGGGEPFEEKGAGAD